MRGPERDQDTSSEGGSRQDGGLTEEESGLAESGSTRTHQETEEQGGIGPAWPKDASPASAPAPPLLLQGAVRTVARGTA